MTETDNLFSDCQIVSYTPEHGPWDSVDVGIVRDGKHYLISLGLPSYLEGLRKNNSPFPTDTKLDENYLPYSGSLDEVDICSYLSGRSWEDLQPYLTEQIPLPSDPAAE